MKRISTIVAVAYFIACGAIATAAPWDHAYAQTPSAQVVTLTKPLPDSNDDGIVAVSAAGAKRYGVPSKGEWIMQRDLAPYTYWLKGYSPPVVTPEPDTVPAPANGWTLSGGDVFANNDQVAVGIRPGGMIGSLSKAPGRGRVGFIYRPSSAELIGSTLMDSFSLGYTAQGKARTSYTNGFAGVVHSQGTLAADGAWSGRFGCVALRQTPILIGPTLRLAITLTNECGVPISNVRYLRSLNADDGLDNPKSKATVNRIVVLNEAEAGLTAATKGKAFYLRSDAPGARASSYGNLIITNVDNPLLTSQAVGYSTKEPNANLNLLGQMGAIEPNGSTGLVLEMGVR